MADEVSAVDQTETTEGQDTGQDAFSWGEIDDDLKSFVGDKSPIDIAKEALSHKQAATRRTEQILNESGFLKPPEQGSEMEFFKAFAPEDVSSYAEALKDTFGDEQIPPAMMDSAKEAGFHPEQFKSFMSHLKQQNAEIVEKSAKEFREIINDHWGADRDAKLNYIQRAANNFRGSSDLDVDGVIEAVSILNTDGSYETQKIIMDTLANFGEAIQEGTTGFSGNPGGMSAKDEHEALRSRAIEKGGLRNLSAADQKRFKELQEELSNGTKG